MNQKSFILSYRFNNRSRQQVLGKYGVLTIEDARKEARKRLVMIDSGEDPAREKKTKNTGDKIEDVALMYLERHAKVHNKPKSWKEDERRIKTHIIPKFGKMKIQALAKSDVAQFHEKIGEKHPYEANRIHSLLSSIFERAREWEIIPENHINPALGIKKFKEKKRDRWVNSNEMPQLIKAIQDEDNIYVRAALMLYILTGMRKQELLNVQWNDVDLERKQIRLSDTKGNRVHYVELSKPAIEILNTIPKDQGNPYVFVGKKPGKPLVNINIPWRRVREKAGLSDVRLHDLRRTFGSWAAMSGVPLLHIGKLLNHSNSSTTEIYAHLSQDPLNQAAEQVGTLIVNSSKKD